MLFSRVKSRICLGAEGGGWCWVVRHIVYNLLQTCSEVNVKILIWLVAKIAKFHTVFITNLQGLL